MRIRPVHLLLSVVLWTASGIAQTFTGQPSVAVNADGRLEVFATGTDSALWHNWQTSPGGSWSGWNSLGGGVLGSPTATINADGRLDVFVLSVSNNVWHIYQTSPGGGWSGWILIGGSISTPPTVALNADGRLEIFARGTDCAGWHAWQEIPGNDFTAWASFGGCIDGSPSVAQNADGRLEIFALGGGNAAYHLWQAIPGGQWGQWSELGGSIASTPTVAINDNGTLEVFAQGTDGAAWHIWQLAPNSAWGNWASLGGGIQGSPTPILNGSESLEIFVTNPGGMPFNNWQVTPEGAWDGWNVLVGAILAPPSAAMNFDGRLEIFGVGLDGNVYHDWELAPGSNWSGWELLSVESNAGTTNSADIPYLWADAQNSANYTAAKNSCSNPPWWTAANAWPCGSRVNINITGEKHLQPFKTAVDNWNSELLSYYGTGVPVQLYINSGGPQSATVVRVANNAIAGSVPSTYGRAANSGQQQDGSGRLLSLKILIIQGMKYGPTITATFAHELGHTFGLNDCDGCSTNGTALNVMDTSEPIPAGHVWGDYVSMNYGEGLPGPTTCDLSVSRSHLSDYAASCIQASSTPPDVPSCTNGSSLGFIDTAQGSSYTCGGFVCTGCYTACNNFASGACPDSGNSGTSTCSNWCGSVCMDTASCGCPGEAPTCEENSGGYFPNCENSCTPIVLDAFGEGFHFTNINGGVRFRVTPDGPQLQMSWTNPEWHNAWLALDRNGNGKIDDFTELFGNMTPQPVTGEPNGYLALAVFDDPMNGGNGNGVIDPQDSVYDHLLLWIDANHDGISEPGELHTLRELGVFRIDLTYQLSNYVDGNGNQFRYKARVWDYAGRGNDVCYDVFLSMQALVPGSN